MTRRLYSYVGPTEIARRSFDTERLHIACSEDAKCALDDFGAACVTFTFIIDREGLLWIADRRTEHIACARGELVLAAGELTLERQRGAIVASYVSNQSTGYCTEPESWHSVAQALSICQILHSSGYDLALEFRRCICGQINIVKNGVFACAVCGQELPKDWNFAH